MSGPKKAQAVPCIQYAALPYRMTDAGAEVLLVTSRETKRWVIPKGWPMKGKDPWDSAAREAREEAGVVGVVGKSAIGSYSYRKRLGDGSSVSCDVEVYPLEVQRQQKNWHEKGQRELAWLSPEKAAEAVLEPDLSIIIRSLAKPSRRVSS